MTSLRLFRLFLRWCVTLALPFLLLLAGARLLLSYEFLGIEYRRPGFPADPYGFTTEDRLEYGLEAISFLFSAEGVEELAQLRLPREKCWQPPAAASDCPLFKARELGHLEDAKRILKAGFTAAAYCLVFAILCPLAVRYMPIVADYRSVVLSGFSAGLMYGAYLTLAVVAALAVFAAAAWDRAFDTFHEIFFPAGVWRFPYSDSLIRLYPEQLFVDAAFVIGGFAAASALLLLAALRLLERSRS